MTNQLRDTYSPVSDVDLTGFEDRSGVRLPLAYRRFLLASNGGRPTRKEFDVPGWPGQSADASSFFGLHDGRYSLDFWFKELGDDLPPGFIPIGVDPGGNFLVMGTLPPEEGHIYYWDSSPDWDLPPEGPTMFKVADSIDEFVESLREASPDGG